MLHQMIQVLSILALTTSQETRNQLVEKSEAVSIPKEVSEFFARQQYSPEVYGLTYLQPKYQSNSAVARLQPQLVLYGPGGQGQPILINPGNPPGNFLIPQRPGPNIIVRSNPQPPQTSGFPSAGYPKPAHIPPIEKDAEEIPTNPAKIPPFQSRDAKPGNSPKGQPEKLETFNEPNAPDFRSTAPSGEFTPFIYNLQPGHRFFILNGQDIYNYPYEAQEDDLSAFRYTNAQPFPQKPPSTLQNFEDETPSQFLSQFPQSPISVPDLLLRNSFVTSNQPIQSESSSKSLEESSEKTSEKGTTRTDQQFFRSALSPNDQADLENPQDSTNNLPSPIGQLAPKNELVQPQLVGQFRFQPEKIAEFYQLQDDAENDAVVVEASFDEPNTKKDSTVTDGISNDPSNSQAATDEWEPSMAQAGPQATAIAGPGGVAGAAPRGTAIVGKGGLAVSSPQATAVAGNKDDDSKNKAEKKAA